MQFTPNFYKNFREQETNDHNVQLAKYLEELEGQLKQRGNFFGGEEANAVDFLIWPWFERLETIQTMRESE